MSRVLLTFFINLLKKAIFIGFFIVFIDIFIDFIDFFVNLLKLFLL